MLRYDDFVRTERNLTATVRVTIPPRIVNSIERIFKLDSKKKEWHSKKIFAIRQNIYEKHKEWRRRRNIAGTRDANQSANSLDATCELADFRNMTSLGNLVFWILINHLPYWTSNWKPESDLSLKHKVLQMTMRSITGWNYCYSMLLAPLTSIGKGRQVICIYSAQHT